MYPKPTNTQGIKTMKPPEAPITQEDRIRQLHALADDAKTDPDARRQFNDACLIHGLIHSDRLDAVLVYTIARIKEVSTEALRELDHIAQRETRRRAKNTKTTPTAPPS